MDKVVVSVPSRSMSISAAAARLGISRVTARRIIVEDQLVQHTAIPRGRIKVCRSDVERLLQRSTHKRHDPNPADETGL